MPVFPRSFVRQLDEYSCGPAALATVARLYGAGPDYMFFRDLMNPCPMRGSKPEAMAAGAKAHLPYTGHGEGSYTGGVAIASIIHVSDVEEGHYVVFLDCSDGEIIYYDPYDHEILTVAQGNLRWVSDDDPPLVEWSVNFSPIKGMTFDCWTKLAGG